MVVDDTVGVTDENENDADTDLRMLYLNTGKVKSLFMMMRGGIIMVSCDDI